MYDLPPNGLLNITLEVQQWNFILQVLTETPLQYKVVQPIMNSIGYQAAQQTAAPQQQEALAPAQADPTPNGVDTAPAHSALGVKAPRERDRAAR